MEDSGTCSCGIDVNSTEGILIVHGSIHKMCSVQLNATMGAKTLIKMQDDLISSTFFFYVKRVGQVTDCPNRYVPFGVPDQNCSIGFMDSSLQLFLQGNVSVQVAELTSDLVSGQCHELSTDFQFAMQANQSELPANQSCHSVKGYGNAIMCSGWETIQEPPEICRLDFCQNCTASLGQREVSFECFEGSFKKSDKVMMIYSIDLKVMDLTDNNIFRVESSTFKDLFNVQEVKLSGNLLKELPGDVFKGLKDLKHLDVSDNRLVTIPVDLFKDLNNLEELKLSGNLLVTLDVGLFEGLKILNHLDVSGNRLVTIPVDLFKDLNDLQELKLSGNLLIRLDVGSFDNLTKLRKLELQFNQLSHIPVGLFHGLKKLTDLYLFRNDLVTIEDGSFGDLQKLQFLVLFGNRLKTLPSRLFQKLHNMHRIYLYKNQLVQLDESFFHNLRSLVYLNVYHNNLSVLPKRLFRGLEKLERLFLAYNHLISLDDEIFDGLVSLRVLALQFNKLTSVSAKLFWSLTNLESLGINNNHIVSLGSGIFTGLTYLQSIFLSSNSLKVVDSDLFQDTVGLIYIDLSGNMLQESPNVHHMVHLRFVNLHSNPLTKVTGEALLGLPQNAEIFVSQHEICTCYVPAHINCSASDERSPYLTCDRLLADRTLMVMMWLIGLNALGGNIFVLAWRRNTTQKNKVQAYVLSNLAMSDLLMGIYMLIIASADIYFGDYFPMQSEAWRSGITCRIAGALSILSSEASVFFVTLISVDRLMSVKYPYSKRKFTKQSVSMTICLVWILSVALGIVPSSLSGFNVKFYDNSHVCIGLPLSLIPDFSNEEVSERVQKDGYYYDQVTFETQFKGAMSGMHFSSVTFLGVNGACYLAIVACYVEIVRVVYQSSKRAGLNKEMKEQLRMTLKISAIVATDFCCWFPVILLGILVQARVVSLPPSVFAWCVTFVLPINSAINPYLYTIGAIVANKRKNQVLDSSTQPNNSQRGGRSETQATQLNSTVSRGVPSISTRQDRYIEQAELTLPVVSSCGFNESNA